MLTFILAMLRLTFFQYYHDSN